MNKAFCTIVAKNYLAYARTLCQSLKQQHPNIPCFVLIVDKLEQDFERDREEFIILEAEELNISNFSAFSFKYDVVELSTAVKPYLLEFLLDRYNLDQLIYLDPDIYVYQPLNKIFSLLEQKSTVLIPHIKQSFPKDGKGMLDTHILLAGIYNLGFIAVTKTLESKALLKWWQDKLYEGCLMNAAQGMCVDQKWLDFAPVMFKEVYILLDYGYNVAYWNLHENEIEYKNNCWYCNCELLYFYHFSGINVQQIDIISKYQNRYNLYNRPELQLLFEKYRDSLIENQYYETIKWNYTYNYYSDGCKISKQDRQDYYRLGEARHEKFPNPFNSRSYHPLKIKIVDLFIKKIFKKTLNLGKYHSSKRENNNCQNIV